MNRSSDSSLLTPAFFVLLGTSLLCLLLLIVQFHQWGTARNRFLLWNLFLAWLPLLASTGAVAWSRRRSGAAAGTGLLALAWLLFFPNAPYLTTDFIHLMLYWDVQWKYEWVFGLWYDLILYFLFAWCGVLLGYMSMQHIHALVDRYLGAVCGWGFVVVGSFLGGFGMYLGRIRRLNSWDVVFSPFRLLEGVTRGLNARGAAFTCLFGVMILIVYLSLHGLRKVALDPKRAGRGPDRPG